MIKSSRLSLKFLNAAKRRQLDLFIDEYTQVVKQFTDMLWPMAKIPNKLPSEYAKQITTWLSARAIQAAGKQASGIVRGTKQKQKQREWVYNNLTETNQLKAARKLKKVIDKTKTGKPEIKIVNPELDPRFVKQDWENPTSFDGMITLTSLGNKIKVSIPVKQSKHFNSLKSVGPIKQGVRLSKKSITFNFELPDPSLKTEGQTIGLDIGVKNVYTLSNNIASQPDIHGHTLDSINSKLARKTKGSKAFLKAQSHRTNYINWSVKQIDMHNIKTLKLEDIKHLRFKQHTNRKLSHFTYTEIYDSLENWCWVNGVQTQYTSPTYTSQRCSRCGWVRSRNRKGKQFKCGICKLELDSDLNAARNISLNLRPIGRTERLLHKNRKGFYWNEVGREPIVSSAQKHIQPQKDIKI